MTDPTEQPDDEPLQRAVRAALDAPTDQRSVLRLERFWRDARMAERTRQQRTAAVAAAAGVLLAVGLTAWRASPPPQVVEKQQDPAAAPPNTPPPTPPVGPAPPPQLTDRPPTPLEVAAFYSMTPRAKRRPIAVLDRPPADAAPTLEEQVAVLIAEGTPRAARQFAKLKPKGTAYGALAARLDTPAATRLLWRLLLVPSEGERARRLASAVPPRAVDELFSGLTSDNTIVRQDAAAVLAAMQGQEVTERLIGIATDEPRHTEAWLALANSQHPLARQFLTYASQQPRLLGFLNAAQARSLASLR